MPSEAVIHCKMKVIATSQSDAVTNSLYWEYIGAPYDVSDAIDALAYEFTVNVAPNLASYLSNQCTITGAEIMVYDADWNPLITTPYIVVVSETGTQTYAMDGAGRCAIIAFTLGATNQIIPNGHNPMKRSYIAFGPLGAEQVDAAGLLNATELGSGPKGAIIAAITGNVEMGTDAAIPVRWGSEVANDGAHTIAYITDAQFRPYASFRRSRMNRR